MPSPSQPSPPDSDVVAAIAQDYLDVDPDAALGIFIGWSTGTQSGIFPLFGTLQNQMGMPLDFSNDTPFELASVSKTFTATLYALALSDGTDPNATLADFPLDIGAQFAPIPLGTLVNYTSGLPEDNESVGDDEPPYMPSPYSTNAMLGFLNMTGLTVTTPGTVYAYSNLGFALAATVMPALLPQLGVAYEQQAAYLWRSLGMDNTAFFDEVRLDQLPLGWNYNGAKAKPVAAGHPDFPAYNGAGGVASTCVDMLNWLQSNMGLTNTAAMGPLLPALQTPAPNVKTPAGDGLGMAWFLGPPNKATPYPTISKDGGIRGTSTWIGFVQPDEPGGASPAGVFVLTNASGLTQNLTATGTPIATAIGRSVLNVMLGYAPLPGPPAPG